MTNFDERKEKNSWNDVLGPFFKYDDLSPEVKDTQGLIVLVTGSGTNICPTFQFETTESGVLHVKPSIAKAWRLLQVGAIEQLHDSEWSAAASLSAPREELDGQAWLDVLRNPEANPIEIENVFELIVSNTERGALWSGIEFTDPRLLITD